MSPTVVEVAPRGDGATCALAGELVVPRLVRRRGRSVEVALVAGRAMLLPGDDVRLVIRVGAGCELTLVDIGGLVVYGRDGESGACGEESGWHARVDLASGARLAWEGLPTVITDAGALDRSLSVTLDPGASCVMRETLVLGRTGERGGTLRMRTDVSDSDGPILCETLTASGALPVPGILGAHRVMDGILAFGDHSPIETVAGATRLELERGGTLLRYLGAAAHESPLAGVTLGALRRDPGVVAASSEGTTPPVRSLACGA
ncbi:hypothetical protein ARHIZOSPH14_05390 [Agromyces rhizosphaerae]|uniref:Urease accessory protein UreD n=1 Tax=Agromyces rhizosphaerae TaxID=88374 RepID=A0A9W6FQ76_9MICO|nr:urease accessory protein UreD [Agromyces rhizosphaerae]GLI26297.1 hypothetical protein ARHIZOSPH14_05390 [Agromyces rhizosphaerae]